MHVRYTKTARQAKSSPSKVRTSVKLTHVLGKGRGDELAAIRWDAGEPIWVYPSSYDGFFAFPRVSLYSMDVMTRVGTLMLLYLGHVMCRFRLWPGRPTT